MYNISADPLCCEVAAYSTLNSLFLLIDNFNSSDRLSISFIDNNGGHNYSIPTGVYSIVSTGGRSFMIDSDSTHYYFGNYYINGYNNAGNRRTLLIQCRDTVYQDAGDFPWQVMNATLNIKQFDTLNKRISFTINAIMYNAYVAFTPNGGNVGFENAPTKNLSVSIENVPLSRIHVYDNSKSFHSIREMEAQTREALLQHSTSRERVKKFSINR